MLPKKGRKQLNNLLFWCGNHAGTLQGISEGVGSSGFSHTLMRSDAHVCIYFDIAYRESSGARRMSGTMYEREGWWKEGQMIMLSRKRKWAFRGQSERAESQSLILVFLISNKSHFIQLIW